MSRLFCFGLGYSGLDISKRMLSQGWKVAGTCHSTSAMQQLAGSGINVTLYKDGRLSRESRDWLASSDTVLNTIPPDKKTGLDPVLSSPGAVEALPTNSRFFYLSTTGVYGDHQGAWVDERTPCRPQTRRAGVRLRIEERLQHICSTVSVFRLGGIYGPERNPFNSLISGKAKRISGPSQVFSRIHLSDLTGALETALENPVPGEGFEVFNLVDDEPASQSDVLAYAAHLLGLRPPPEIPLEEAGLSQMAESFYRENRRVYNRKLKRRFGYSFRYPNYRDGLKSLVSQAGFR